jgi:hypothetical protein
MIFFLFKSLAFRRTESITTSTGNLLGVNNRKKRNILSHTALYKKKFKGRKILKFKSITYHIFVLVGTILAGRQADFTRLF